MEEDNYKMLSLILAIAFIIIIGLFIASTEGYATLTCADSNEPYTAFEPYTIYENETIWGEIYLQVLDKVSINIPSNRPNYISYDLCSPCKYNVTFISDLPTNFFIFDQYNKNRYFDRESAFPLVSEFSGEYKNFSFEINEKGKYYFVFDRSAQGTNTNDPSIGRLTIYELKGHNQTTRITKYKEVIKYRNITRCL